MCQQTVQSVKETLRYPSYVLTIEKLRNYFHDLLRTATKGEVFISKGMLIFVSQTYIDHTKRNHNCFLLNLKTGKNL